MGGSLDYLTLTDFPHRMGLGSFTGLKGFSLCDLRKVSSQHGMFYSICSPYRS